MTLYTLAMALALFGSGLFSCGVIAVLSFAVSGIAETMHRVESDDFSLLVTLAIIAVCCLVAFIISLIKYIKICIKERNLKKTILSILLFLVLLPVFLCFILNIV